MARLPMSFVAVLLLFCAIQWQVVECQTGYKPLNLVSSSTSDNVDAFTHETIYDSDSEQLPGAAEYETTDVDAGSTSLANEVYNYASNDVDTSQTSTSFESYSAYSATDDVGTNENSGTDNIGTADDSGFDYFENDEDDVSSSDSSDELGASLASSNGCSTGNPVDDCWRCDSNWASRRQSLASCAVGFGKGAIGGKNGKIYVVTSAADDNAANPAYGTLRYGVTRLEPLWITFAHSMTVKLKYELLIASYKTIDGRGVNVHIAGGGGLTMQRVSNIIVHGISIHDIKATGPGRIMTSTAHTGNRGRCDGDAISIFASKSIWIDHCYFSKTADGLIDVIRGSTDVSITNNYFTKHDKVMLFGANKNDVMDREMRVTVAYNTFGPGLGQRMPRVRYGRVHVVNNDYSSGWAVYAIAGSEDPTILSQGNVFNAFTGSKQVTKRIDDGGPSFGGPKNWNWRSEGDTFQSGAYFTSVPMKWSAQSYSKTASCSARPASMVKNIVRGSGPLNCSNGSSC